MRLADAAAIRPHRTLQSIDLSWRALMADIPIPLPRRDFDPSEVTMSWRTLHIDGHQVIFATPDGQAASANA